MSTLQMGWHQDRLTKRRLQMQGDSTARIDVKLLQPSNWSSGRWRGYDNKKSRTGVLSFACFALTIRL